MTARRWWICVIVVAVVGLFSFMHRQRYRTSADVMREALARIDSDHDGRISKDEWKRYNDDDKAFARYDVNGDGYLDLDEFTRMFWSFDPGYYHRGTTKTGGDRAAKGSPTY